MWNLDEVKNKSEHCLNCKARPCTNGCPLGNTIPDFIKCIKEERYKDAYEVLNKTTVLESICGRVCPHDKQCQGNCVRGIMGTPVSIGELEAFIGDMAIENGWKIAKENIEKNDKKIAIVGSGPCGLTCAAFLAKKGFNVTIYEKHEMLGGLLRYCIPEFRLDKSILDKQINRILELGIEAICGKELGIDFSIEDLQEKYDAVFLAFGANISRKMNVPGEDLNGVYGGNELLEKGNHPDYTGKRVAIIGGGNVAMDVSRTIKRLGADKVYVVYRRAEEQMPAERKEIEDAKNEDIEFLFQNNLVKINGQDTVKSIECVKTELVQREDSDRLVPVDIKDSNFTLDIDYVVMALGAEADSIVTSKLNIKLNNWGYICVDKNYMTSIPSVFAGGDLIENKPTVAWAARSGRDVAEAIVRFFE